MPGSPLSGFTNNDPIRLLAHNLDFWIPPVTEVIQERLCALPTGDNGVEPGPVPLVDGSALEGVVAANPRKGGDVWRGEAEAAEIVNGIVEEADADGRLRGILDAVRSNRVEEVVVLLSSGITNLTEIADIMGYSNHSPVSKRLARIRQHAESFFADQ